MQIRDGEKLMGTTRRKNEDLKSQGESYGFLGRAFLGGAWRSRQGLSDQAH